MKKFSLVVMALSLLVPVSIVLADAPAGTAVPAGQFAKKHPRRAQVNHRIKNQRQRINKDLSSGKINQQQADQLRANDRAIKQQERADVKANGGSLTKDQQ